MNFKQWIEAKTFSPTHPAAQNAQQEVVNGWQVYYDLLPEYIQMAKSVAQKGTAALQSLNVRKNLRIPILFVWGKQGFTRGQYMYERTKTPYVVVDLYFEKDPVGLLIHEIGHSIYTMLGVEQQKQIDDFANRYPKISPLGEPSPKGESRKRDGEEWFPECIRLLATGGLSEDNISLIPREVIRTIKSWLSNINTAPQSDKFYATDQRPRYLSMRSKPSVTYNHKAPSERIPGIDYLGDRLPFTLN